MGILKLVVKPVLTSELTVEEGFEGIFLLLKLDADSEVDEIARETVTLLLTTEGMLIEFAPTESTALDNVLECGGRKDVTRVDNAGTVDRM